MWRFIFPVVLLALMLAGCNPGRPSEKEGPVANPLADTGNPAAEIRELDIGDVETSVTISATLADRSAAGGGIQVDAMKTPRGDLVLVTIDVNPPAPPELWVTVKLKSSRDFETRPVAVRGHIFREVESSGEKTDLSTFELVLGKNARMLPQSGQGPLMPCEYQVNVLDGLATTPQTMLVVAEAELLMLPEGTPENLVDPHSATADDGNIATVMSNPIRINFTGDGSTS